MPAERQLTRQTLLKSTASSLLSFLNLQETAENEKPDATYLFGQIATIVDGGIYIFNLATQEHSLVHSFDRTTQQIPKTLSLSPDQEFLAVAAQDANSLTISLMPTQREEAPQLIYSTPSSPNYINLEWSPDGKTLAAVQGDRTQNLIIVDIKSKQNMFPPIQEATHVSFSPDGKIVAVRTQTRTHLFNLLNKDHRSFSGEAKASHKTVWSPDGKTLAVTGGNTTGSSLGIYNTEIDEVLVFPNAEEVIGFSPDGIKLVIFEKAFGNPEVVIIDLKTGKRTPPVTLPVHFQNPAATWNKESELFLASTTQNSVQVIAISPETGQITKRQEVRFPIGKNEYVAIDPRNAFLDPNTLLFQKHSMGEKTLLGIINIKTGQITYLYETPQPPTSQRPHLQDIRLISFPENSMVASENHLFILHKGEKLHIQNPETAEIFLSEATKLPPNSLSKTPDFINHLIEFEHGDLLKDPQGKLWLVRDNSRYNVTNLDSFQPFNRTVWETPQWLLEMLPIGRQTAETHPITGVDGHTIENPNGEGIVILLLDGYNSNTISVRETFVKPLEVLQQALPNIQVTTLTYKVAHNPETGKNTPLPYYEYDTKIYPPYGSRNISDHILELKRLLPRKRFIVLSFSLGGHNIIQAAQKHTDAILAVITVDSPILGLSWLSESSVLYQTAIKEFIGEDAGAYLLNFYKDQESAKEVEKKVRRLQEKGLFFFTFTNKDDWLVTHDVAHLPYANQTVAGEKIQTLWELGHLGPINFKDLISGHYQTLNERRSVGEIVKAIKLLLELKHNPRVKKITTR